MIITSFINFSVTLPVLFSWILSACATGMISSQNTWTKRLKWWKWKTSFPLCGPFLLFQEMLSTFFIRVGVQGCKSWATLLRPARAVFVWNFPRSARPKDLQPCLSVVVPSDGRERREEPAVAQLCLVDVSNWMIFKLLLIIYNKLLTAVVVAASEHI